MPRPRSQKTQAALDDIAAGMSQAAAAKKHGVDQGLLSRMLRPTETTVSVKLTLTDLDCLTYLLQYGDLYDKLEKAFRKLQDKNHEKKCRIEK